MWINITSDLSVIPKNLVFYVLQRNHKEFVYLFQNDNIEKKNYLIDIQI